ncbi:MAG: DNA topoisomerase I [Candidatus Aenigmarchaeota archaeon]|nr:DNA topoisomerase I [Candidatus Aenigmarchaeota archaeon]
MEKIIILTEKPTAMRKIAYSLFPIAKKIVNNKVPYFVSYYNNKIYYVVSALGHLFKLEPQENNFDYPIFNADWEIVDNRAEKFAKLIKDLARDVNKVIVATDYDIEGYVIAWNILKYLIGLNKEIKRMKFSTLTKSEIIKSFSNLIEFEINQVNAGLARHYLDWYWGINLSRALMISLRKVSNEKRILSIGRVQGPALYLVYLREKEIENFKPEIYYKIKLEIEKNGIKFYLFYIEDRIKDYNKAKEIIEKIKNKKIKIVQIKEEEYKLNPLPPFNTTDLQEEAYYVFGFKPEYTLKIAESLYLKGYISYPRSSSQKLKGINIFPILNSISKIPFYSYFVKEILSFDKIEIVEGKKDDPAHPAIIPTEEIPDFKKLSKPEIMLYDLIVKRFLVCLHKPAIRKSIKVIAKVDNFIFHNTFHRTVKENWLKIYKDYIKLEEDILPTLSLYEEIPIKSVNLLKEKTKPPARYTRASLIKELESRNLGTKATRAEIVKTLYDRKYVIGDKMKITDLGKAVVEIFLKYCPEILSEELTRDFERKMDEIIEGKNSLENVLNEAKSFLLNVLRKIKEYEKEIGNILVNSLAKQ